MSDFVKEIHNMFDHIWDCEIDHPVYQDTVGELMEAVIQAHEKHNLTHGTNLAEVGTDCISREQAINALRDYLVEKRCPDDGTLTCRLIENEVINKLPTAQPEIIRCKDCIYYDPPHVENNGVRYEYDEMPADAFDALGTGLVNAEYGINIGGRCCVDYYCKNYSDDKRVFVREDNYCGRAERRTDE